MKTLLTILALVACSLAARAQTGLGTDKVGEPLIIRSGPIESSPSVEFSEDESTGFYKTKDGLQFTCAKRHKATLCFALALFLCSLPLLRRRAVVLCLLASAGIAFNAQAQTNITLNILVEEPARTNTVSLPLTQLHVSGFNLNWEAHKVATGTNALAFRFFVRQETRDRLETLKTEARTAELKAAKIDAITTSILLNWDNATAADRKLLTDWLTKYPPQ